jgi:hypothetical protein
MNKYYWVLVEKHQDHHIRAEGVIENHPFTLNPHKYLILDWKKITKKEFDLYRENRVNNGYPYQI